jgi:lipid II isoglutaminyl synthase (glutamine-hydrolysing)
VALAAGRTAGWASRATGRGAGAQISGTVMLKVNPDLLAELAADQRVVLVSATNGKTTTTHFLVSALEAAGEHVVTNVTGANLASGLASALQRAKGPGIAVLEVDERVLPRVVDALHPELLVLGNLSRDQLDRFGEVGSVTAGWRAVTQQSEPPAIVANASDPAVVWAAQPAGPTWVGLGTRWRQDASTCPRCRAVLDWGDDSFACASCSFGQPVTSIRLAAGELVIDDRHIRIDLAIPGEWNEANAALAIVAATHFGVDAVDAARALGELTTVSGRYATFTLGNGRDARVLLAKNPAGWHEILRWLGPRDTGVVIALNAHIADGRDPSWLWDVPFEALSGHAVAATGERALDVAVRLDYAGVPITVEADPLAAAEQLDGAEVHIVASYTQFTRLTKRLRRRGARR